MGPRLFSRGNFDFLKVYALSNPASMGPRLFSRGNVTGRLTSSWKGNTLQWGHDFSAVEMQEAEKEEADKAAEASMGPRLFSRGNGTKFTVE